MRLPAEALAVAAVGGQRLREDLERHDPVVLGVEGPVDLTHATATEQRLDAIGTELFEFHRETFRVAAGQGARRIGAGRSSGRSLGTDPAPEQASRPGEPRCAGVGRFVTEP